MVRRLFAVTVALCLSGWAVQGAERATFTLTGGGRISGSDEVIVPATTPWTDTGRDVMPGDQFRFGASGAITLIHARHSTAGPGGMLDVTNHKRWLSSEPLGALIGKVGAHGAPFAIGGDRGIVTMISTGRLMLGVNDTVLSDNSGAFQVTIMRGR